MQEPTTDIFEQSNRLRRQLLLTWILMLLLVVLLAMPALKLWFNFGVSGDPRPITPRGELAAIEKTTINLFNETSPSVVYINTKSPQPSLYRRSYEEVDSGTGSGFVWDEDGHIVTNYHVIENASSAQVSFFDQSGYEASLVGISPSHDLAVLRVKAPEGLLRPVLVGESSDLKVGQSVFAIGNPFGLNQTLTTGIISAKSRTIQSPNNAKIDDVIQIDAAINPGNSGGPLLDSAGRLVGVNTAIYSPSGASAGVGFAIPVDVVNLVVPEIIRKGKFEPATLGISIIDSDNERLKRFTGVDGVAIFDLAEDGPADKAGLRPFLRTSRGMREGDIIVKIDDKETSTVRELQDALLNYRPGDKVTITFSREDKIYEAELELD
ncbi:MAG: S1C family serine protease [Pirellulaceae bacterium]